MVVRVVAGPRRGSAGGRADAPLGGRGSSRPGAPPRPVREALLEQEPAYWLAVAELDSTAPLHRARVEPAVAEVFDVPPETVRIVHGDTDTAPAGIGALASRSTAIGGSAREAQEKAYRAVDLVDWEDGFCRRDIGWRAVDRERNQASGD